MSRPSSCTFASSSSSSTTKETSATSQATNTSNDKTTEPNNHDSSCASCVNMLRQILAGPDARPRKILDGFASRFVWRPTPDGLQVQIPTPVALPQRRWSRLHVQEEKESVNNKESSSSRTSSLLPVMLQATSAAPRSVDPQERQQQKALQDNFEWMQISCKPCSNRGPEAGARAFVMGPTPLSMVVCTNRLQGTSPEAKRAELEEILTHEFMHVYDVRQMQLDLRDCENLAYSEIRAARQAECQSSWAPQACTRVKAQTATQNLFPTMGASCIRTVWEKAYQDTRPFGPADESKSNTKRPFASSR